MAIGDLILEIGAIADTALTETNKAIRSYFDGIGPQPQESDTWGPVGWFGRPKDPVAENEATPLSPAGACEAIAWNSPDAAQPMAFRDLRLSSPVSPESSIDASTLSTAASINAAWLKEGITTEATGARVISHPPERRPTRKP